MGVKRKNKKQIKKSSWDHHVIQADEICCANCCWWDPPGETHRQNGECRKLPPRPTGGLEAMIAEALASLANHFGGEVEGEATEAYQQALWPTTVDYDFCGSFQKENTWVIAAPQYGFLTKP